jgi:hypothetical protein
MKAVICAAGFGTKLKLNMPKAMVMINGKRIIDYQLKALKNYDEIYVVVGYRSNLIIEHLKKHSNIKFIINNEPGLGIMHTMHLISNEINELALILDGDLIINDELPLYDYEFIGIRTPVCHFPIYCNTDKDQVLSFGSNKTDYEWANIYCTNPRMHDWNTDLVHETLSRSLPKISVRFDSFKIGTPEDKSDSYDWLKKFLRI